MAPKRRAEPFRATGAAPDRQSDAITVNRHNADERKRV